MSKTFYKQIVHIKAGITLMPVVTSQGWSEGQFMRVKNVVVEKINLILHVNEEQKVKTVEMQCGDLSFLILQWIYHVSQWIQVAWE